MQNINTNTFYSRLIDLSALTVSFLLFSMMTSHLHPLHFLLQLAAYVGIVFVTLRLSKRFIFDSYHTSSRIIRVLLGNLLGFVSGVVLLLMLSQVLPLIVDSALVVIFSSILAFFILGTLSPMVKSSNLDVIHH